MIIIKTDLMGNEINSDDVEKLVNSSKICNKIISSIINGDSENESTE